MLQPKIPLHDYQIFAKNFMLQHPYAGLFLKMGLGKTSIVLEGLYELNPKGHVLIIAPKTIARCTWINEIKKWNIPFRTQSLIVNKKGKNLSKKKREEIFDTIPTAPPTVYFINRDLVSKLVDYFPGNKWCFPIVVIDESQSFKSYSSMRFKKLASVRPYMFRLIELTGSPAPNGLMDLWSQIYLLDMGTRLGRNITQYRDVYFNPGLKSPAGYPITWNLKFGAKEAIYERIGDITISMENKYIKLPELTFNDIYVELEDDEKKRYREFAKTYILDLKNGEQIEAANAAVLQAKLSQMASGAIYTQKNSHEYEKIHEHKLEMCEYIVNNTDDNVLIAYHFQSDKDMLLNYFKEHDLEAVTFDGTPEMEQAWNRKEIPIMLVQPASCGFGLNLQDGGATLIWYTIPWSLEHYEQMNARIYRQGQTQPCVIHHLMTRHTVDDKILKAIHKKDISQSELMDAIAATFDDIDNL